MEIKGKLSVFNYSSCFSPINYVNQNLKLFSRPMKISFQIDKSVTNTLKLNLDQNLNILLTIFFKKRVACILIIVYFAA